MIVSGRVNRPVPKEFSPSFSKKDGQSMLILGDCLEKLKDLPDGSVDAVVTDPPFGIGFHYGEGKKDVARSPEVYGEFTKQWLAEALRVAKPGALIAVWQPAKYFKHFWDWFGDDIHIYAACKNFVQLRKIPINYAFDPVVMFYKPGSDPLRPVKPMRNVDFFVANTAPSVASKYKPERKHPCPRPLNGVQEMLRNFVLPGGVVLDPFMGSGTTGLAAKLEGFQFIGIEKEPDYYTIAEARIASVLI